MDKYQAPMRTGLMDFLKNSSGCQFVIPVYQRNYTWNAGKEVKQFLDDLKSVLTGEYDNHFLGVMFYLDTPIDFSAREYSVIDGQQRLTTTFLTLYAVRSILIENNEVAQIHSLEGQYLTNPYSTVKMKYKLKPLVSDDEVYQCIVEDKLSEIKDKESCVYKNYNYIIDYLKGLLAEDYTINDILMAINKLYIVCVPISEDDNAQKIFESINATGVKLTASDLIRNFLLMDLQSETQETFYTNYWKKIEDYISTDAKKLELFFRMFLAIKNYSLPTSTAVYRLFIDWFKDQSKDKDTETILCEIVNYAKSYYFVYKKDLNEIDKNIAYSLKEFRRILSDMPAPALVEFNIMRENNLITNEDFSNIVKTISYYLIRRSLCDLDTSSITKLFPSLLKNILNDCKDFEGNNNYDNIVKILEKDLIAKNIGNAMYMPDDQQLYESVINANMYNLRSTLRIVLDRMEHENNPAPVDLSKLSIEHLMPQSPTKQWIDALGVDEDTYQKNLHRLGNLTLATKPDNSAMGNKPWEYKNAILQTTSHLKLNEDIIKLPKWDIDEIDNRTKLLIDRIIKMYPYPEINKDIIPRKEIFLMSDNIIATGYLSLDDGSVEIDIGSQLVPFNCDNALQYPEYEELRKDLADDGIIAEVDGILQFVKPYTFYTKFSGSTALSSAAGVLLCANRSGWQYWMDADGNSLRDDTLLRTSFPYMK